MSNYTEFVKNYLNKNVLNEALDANKLVEIGNKMKASIDKAIKNNDEESVVKAFVEVCKAGAHIELANALSNISTKGSGTNTKITFGALSDPKKKNAYQFPLVDSKMDQSAFTAGLLSWINGLNEKSDEWSKDSKNNNAVSTIYDILTKNKLTKKIQAEFEKLANHQDETKDFNTKLAEWEKFGKVITYYSIEMMSVMASKETVDTSKMQKYMHKVFTGGSKEYFNKITKVEDLMRIDAALGVMEFITSNHDKEHKDQQQMADALIRKVSNIINEATVEVPKDVDSYKALIQQANEDPKTMSVLKDTVNKIEHDYSSDFKDCMDKIETRFDNGRAEIIEKEKSDTVTDFHDPLDDSKVEKRIGRLGNHGPMTFIKNHEKLNKSVEAIEGQKWNIFNCAAKLLIKLFKLIEDGSKAMRKFKEEIASGLKDIQNSVKNEKIPEFQKEIQDVMDEEETSPDDKAMKILLLLSTSIRKYENNLYESFSKLVEKPWIKPSEENDGENKVKLYALDKEFTTEIQNKVGLINEVFSKVYIDSKNALAELDKQKQSGTTKTEETSSEKTTEGSSEEKINASYKPNYKNIVNEADEVLQDTQKAVEEEGEKVAKNAEKEKAASSEADAKDNKDAETKPEETASTNKTADEDKPWQEQKFDFDDNGLVIERGKYGKYVENGYVTEFSNVYRNIAKKLQSEGEIVFNAIADFIDITNPEKKLSEGRLMFQKEATISTITGKEFMDGCEAILNKLKEVYPNIKQVTGISEIKVENVQEIQEEIQETVDQQDAEDLSGLGSGVLALGWDKKSEDKDSNSGNNGNNTAISNMTSDILNAIKGTNRENYKNTIDIIKKKRDDLVKEWTEYQKKWQNGVIEFKKAKPGIKDNKFSKKQALNFFHPDKISWPKNEHIIPTIWLINNYFSNVVEWNNTYKMGTLQEATNSKMDKGFDDALKQIEVCIPDDIKSEVYNKTYDAFMQGEYAEFKKIVSGLVNIIVKNKNKLKEDYLKMVNQESADKFVAYLEDENTDDLLKLESMLGYFVSDDEETDDNLPDELKKKILEFTSTIAKITDKSEPKKVAEYKKKGEDLYKEIQSALKDNEEMSDYLAEFLKRLQEATKETESLFVISIVYALNVFASADELKPLMENFTKITNCFLLEGLGNSKLTKAVRGYVSSSAKGDDKAKMQAVQTIAKELKANPKIKLEDLKGSNLGAAAFEDLKKDLESVNGSPEKEQASKQDSKEIEELKAKLPEWLKKLIACAEAGKKPVTIKQYAGEYNPIKEDVTNYYNKLKEAKKVPEDQVTNDVLLQVLQIAAVVNGGNKEEAKPEQSSSNVPATTEQPKEGGTQESLNWLADEFYKYIRG